MSSIDQNLLAQLQQLIQQSDLEVSEQQAIKLVQYVQMMVKWNKAYNLTSVRQPEQMLVKHIMDSIMVAPHLVGSSYIDVGTGPGLPGIPLAIMCAQKHFVLLDSLGKRVRFMKQVGFELGLDNIQPVQSRVEDFQPAMPIDGVLSRAFASLKDMLHWCQHLVDTQGEFLALKGLFPADELAQLPQEYQLKHSIELTIPGLEGSRHLLIINKI